jgi:hypothetical protein
MPVRRPVPCRRRYRLWTWSPHCAVGCSGRAVLRMLAAFHQPQEQDIMTAALRPGTECIATDMYHAGRATGPLIFLMVLPPSDGRYCGSGSANGRGDIRPGGCCEHSAGLGRHCRCDSPEHGDLGMCGSVRCVVASFDKSCWVWKICRGV